MREVGQGSEGAPQEYYTIPANLVSSAGLVKVQNLICLSTVLLCCQLNKFIVFLTMHRAVLKALTSDITGALLCLRFHLKRNG